MSTDNFASVSYATQRPANEPPNGPIRATSSSEVSYNTIVQHRIRERHQHVGVGPITAAQIQVSQSHPGRFRSQVADSWRFAAQTTGIGNCPAVYSNKPISIPRRWCPRAGWGPVADAGSWDAGGRSAVPSAATGTVRPVATPGTLPQALRAGGTPTRRTGRKPKYVQYEDFRPARREHASPSSRLRSSRGDPHGAAPQRANLD